MPTIGEIHSSLLTGATLRAGMGSLRRGVAWAVRLRARSPAFDRLDGGELVLVPLAVLPLLDGSPGLAYVVHQLAHANVSAIAVIGTADMAAIRAAEERAMPLLELPADTLAEHLELDLQRWLLERQAEAQRRASTLQQELTELALAGVGLQALVDRVVRITGKSVLLHDSDWTLWAGRSPAAGPAEALIERAVVASAPEVEGWAQGIAELAPSDAIVPFHVRPLRVVRLVAPIRDGSGFGAYLSLMGEFGTVTEHDRAALMAAAMACAIELVRERASTATRDALEGNILEMLLRGDFANQAAVLARAQRLGHDLTAPHAALAISSTEETCSRRLYRFIEGLGSGRPPLVAQYAGLSLALVPLEPEDAADRRLSRMAHEWHRALALQLGRVSMGLGGLHTGLDGLSLAITEARQAHDMGQRLFGEGRLAVFSELGLYSFLLSAHSPEHLQAFHEQVLGSLRAYDEAHEADLLPTLEAYFASRCSPQAAAEKLHLHRNSLLYRLKRIEAVANVDIEDPETRLLLHLALRVGQTIPLVANALPFSPEPPPIASTENRLRKKIA